MEIVTGKVFRLRTNSYAYNENDQEYKPASFFVRLMAKAAARGGNILMNIGPMGTGKFSAPDLDILKQIAAWWKVNGEASIVERRLLRLAVQSLGENLPVRRISLFFCMSFDLAS